MITDLHEAINAILAKETKLFSGVYSHGRIDYDMEFDEFSTTINTVRDNTQYVFSVNIEPVGGQNRNNPFEEKWYKVNVQEFAPMQDSIIISGKSILDFLLNAEIQLQDTSPHLELIYPHSSQ